jgi:hypothetical protein
MELNDFNGNDQANHRVYDLENGNKLHLKRVDPYGFVYLNLDKGQLPLAYTGSYTDWFHARLAAEKYIQERKDAFAEIERKNQDKPYTHPKSDVKEANKK